LTMTSMPRFRATATTVFKFPKSIPTTDIVKFCIDVVCRRCVLISVGLAVLFLERKNSSKKQTDKNAVTKRKILKVKSKKLSEQWGNSWKYSLSVLTHRD
jgi:hypothetical protein